MEATTSPDHVAQALNAYDTVLAATPGYRTRAGQRTMVMALAEAFADATLGEIADDAHVTAQTVIRLVQAGTGVGKSTGYVVPGVVLAKAKGVKLVISTATVALQEQLVGRDLPALAKVLPGSFSYALAKGRSRYLCPLKLDARLDEESQAGLYGFGQDEYNQDAGDSAEPDAAPLTFYRELDASFADSWDGDRDTLAEQPEPSQWASVAAERHGCSGRRCPRYRDCPFFAARSELAKADVIVANHDLVLSTLGSNALPELHKCLLVFDEGHHLPAKAIDQFSGQIHLTRLRWLRKLPKVLAAAGALVDHDFGKSTEQLADTLRQRLAEMQSMLRPLVERRKNPRDTSVRFVRGELPEPLVESVHAVSAAADELCEEVRNVGTAMREAMKASNRPALAQTYALLGQLTPSLDDILECTTLLKGGEEIAKWIEFPPPPRNGGAPAPVQDLLLRACPINPGELLERHLWSKTRAVAITSATLTSCGSFGFFLQESGLDARDNVSTVTADSPFDYASQGRLRVVRTLNQPKALDAFNQEVSQLLAKDLAQLKGGALALFASRKSMMMAVDAIPAALLPMVLVQGAQSRNALLREHASRIAQGKPSVIFGLQSFGEGLDLPGELCERLYIGKLPFAPPTDPVGEARAEYLSSRGGNPFDELVVPAVGMKLLQWTGRAIRTETDRAEIVVYDERLASTRYGRTILQGLPPYPLHTMKAEALVE